jgi:hypothetical protein
MQLNDLIQLMEDHDEDSRGKHCALNQSHVIAIVVRHTYVRPGHAGEGRFLVHVAPAIELNVV